MGPLRFLRYAVLVALPILFGVAAYCYIQRAYFPAPKLTRNIAINEQWHRVAQLRPLHADVVSIGSSMTLNNLASDVVAQHFHGQAFTNAGAWGIGASEMATLAPVLVQHLHPSMIIVVTNLMDFQKGMGASSADSIALGEHFDRHGSWIDYVRNVDAPYYLRQMETNKIRFTDAANYEYLGFDEHGGISLNVPSARIDRSRFNEAIPDIKDLKEERYAAFERFAHNIRGSNVKLVVLQSPYRDGLRSATADSVIAAHVARVRSILEPLGHTYVDANERQWSDTLYCDASHFNRLGAEEFTAWCMERLGQ